MSSNLFNTLTQALQNREHRAALKQYEKKYSKYDEKCKAIAKEVVSTILSDIAAGDDMNYIMIVSQETETYSFSFSTASVALSNQHVKRDMVFPQVPERPVDPNAGKSDQLYKPGDPVAWKYIRAALEEAGVPTKELRLNHDLVIFITLESIGSSKIRVPDEKHDINEDQMKVEDDCESSPTSDDFDDEDEGFTPAYD